jgi:hypothetical protein
LEGLTAPDQDRIEGVRDRAGSFCGAGLCIADLLQIDYHKSVFFVNAREENGGEAQN